MQVPDPPWKIRTRPCPFYSQGKCLFAKNCSFLHQVKSTPTVIRVTAPEDDDSDVPDSIATVPAKLPFSTPPQTHADELPPSTTPHGYQDSFLDEYASQDEGDTSDPDSPTIRKFVLPPVVTHRDNVLKETVPSRDSVATVKGDTRSSETASHTSKSHSPLPKFYVQPRRESSSSPSSFSFSSPPRNDSREGTPLLPPFSETVSSVPSPSSAISATAQVVEVSNLPGSSWTIPAFTLANAGSSSLLSNRLAKSRGNPLSLASAPLHPPTPDPSTPYSAGALYASYQQEDAAHVPVSPRFADARTDSQPASPEVVDPTPHVIPKTPSWLRPLRLASAFTQTGSRPTSSSPNNSRQFTAVSDSQSSSISISSSVSSGLLYDSPVAPDNSNDLCRTSSTSSIRIPTDTPHTIVLSDHDGYVSPLTISRPGSLDIDMSGFPPHLASSPEDSVRDPSSSPASISMSELTGRSPRAPPVASSVSTIHSPADAIPEVDTPPLLEKVSSPAEQLRSALERRAKRMREGSQLLASTEVQNLVLDPSFSTSYSQSLLPDTTVSTSISHSRSMPSMPDFNRSQSWSSLPHIEVPTHADPLPTTSASDSLLLQAQSSPPRNSPRLRPTLSISSTTSPRPHAAVMQYSRAPSPDPSPRPQLLFAIASDQPEEVERLLSSGEASVGETTGTGTGLLEFTVANEGLKNKTQIVKTLLKYGADPGPFQESLTRDDTGSVGDFRQSPELVKKVEEGMNPALKYYLTRPQSLDVDSKPALEALQQSSFAPLARARFDIIGQDRALDEFYRVLGMHSQRKGRNALVILLCGASGHGKSLLAQKVGSLLDVPTHTINMTALRSQHDLWQCLSTGIDDASPDLDLSEFLVENQGKRCVVVLDEIEKVDDSKSLNPLLLPWDIGRCSLEQKKHTDTSKVIWIATSNLGQKLIFDHVEQWAHPDSPPTRAEYTQLATAVRRRIAEVLGASLLSRITAILPFLPFTEVEKIAIGTEAALSHGEFMSAPLAFADIEALVRRAVKDVNFVEEEGARSLYRVVETHLSMRT